MRTIELDDEWVKLQIWDIARQELFKQSQEFTTNQPTSPMLN